MSVRIYPAPLKHPSECDVCQGSRRVEVAAVVPTDVHRERIRWLPTRLVSLVDCPQCAGAEELLAYLPRRPGPGWGGGPRATA